MRRKLKIVGIIALASALAFSGWWWGVRDKPPSELYKTAVLERGALQASVSATGVLNPVRQVQISSQVSGQIKELLVDFNSPVREGQLIARLDPETFDQRVRQARADVDAARAASLTAQANVAQALAQASKVQVDLDEALRDSKLKQELIAQNFISASEADKAAAVVRSQTEALKAAQAQVAVARAQTQSAQAVIRQREAVLRQAQVDVRRTEIRSPVDGIVIKRTVEVGQTVAASLQAPELFVIARNLHDMQVEASIDEADVARVREGQPATFTIDAFPGRNFEGRVSQVRQAAVSVQNVTTYTVVVSFTNPDGPQPLPGMTANVRIVTDARENVLRLPNAALRVRLAGVAGPADSASAARREGKAPRPPGAQAGGGSGTGVQRGRIFVLASDEKGRMQPQAYSVRLGITDGLFTELLAPSSEASSPQEGSTVIVGVNAPTDKPGAPPGPRSPF
jgi:HlyD family secretion protein